MEDYERLKSQKEAIVERAERALVTRGWQACHKQVMELVEDEADELMMAVGMGTRKEGRDAYNLMKEAMRIQRLLTELKEPGGG